MNLSVVIPCYNAATQLPRVVQSVLQQGTDGTEIIVVDDASTDATLQLAEQLGGGSPSLRVVRQDERRGLASARNVGLSHARGKYVCFLDADGACGEETLGRGLAVLESATWVDAVELASNLIVRREFAQAIGGFPELPAPGAGQSAERIAFHRAVRIWGNVVRLAGPVSLREKGGAGANPGILEYLRGVAARMADAAALGRTQVIQIQHSERAWRFEVFETDGSFRHASETLTGQTYPAVPFLPEVGGVLDIGANIGASAVVFATRYPKARIVAVEPSRKACALLRRNTRGHPGVECYHLGLFDTTARRSLFMGFSDSVTNSLMRNRLTTAQAEEVQLVAADAFIALAGMERPDVIKIDTEGCEVPIMRSASAAFLVAKAVYLEYHSEDDRAWIDRFFGETHILFRGKAREPHRGEAVYVRNDAFPPGLRDRYRMQVA